MGTILLQIFLYFDVFLVGVVATLVARHLYSHFHPPRHHPESHHDDLPYEALPADFREHLLKVTQANIQTMADHFSTRMQKDLNLTENRLTDLLARIGTEVIGREMERYRLELVKMHQQNQVVAKNEEDAMGQREKEMEAKLNQEMIAEKQRLIQQLDTKLADAVSSFLIEAMQHNVDLGAQNDYLMSELEKHKEDLKREVAL
jgi:hypothetical protein